MENKEFIKERVEKLELILVPTDFSPFSCEAFPWAALFAMTFDSKVLILHVIPKSTADWMTGIPGNTWESILEREDKWMIDYFMASISDNFNATIDKDTLVEVGHAPTKIIKVAKEKKVNMIVIGTHGRTGLSHILMGSIAEKVVRQASCPVFTVKPRAFRIMDKEESLEKIVISKR